MRYIGILASNASKYNYSYACTNEVNRCIKMEYLYHVVAPGKSYTTLSDVLEDPNVVGLKMSKKWRLQKAGEEIYLSWRVSLEAMLTAETRPEICSFFIWEWHESYHRD